MSPQRPQVRYGMRGDGSNADGNEPGGANGMFGSLGGGSHSALPGDVQQAPPIQGGPMAQANMQQAMQAGANLGGAAKKASQRYGMGKATLDPSNPSFSGGSGDSTATLGFPQASNPSNPGAFNGEDGTQQQMGEPTNPAPADSPMADQNMDMGATATPTIPGDNSDVGPGQMGPNYPSPTPTVPGSSTHTGPGQAGPNYPGSAITSAPSNSPMPDMGQGGSQPGMIGAPAMFPGMGGQGMAASAQGAAQGAASDAAAQSGAAASGGVGAPATFSGGVGGGGNEKELATAALAMRSGGAVTKPTIALLGEDGPEAVVPLANKDAKITPGMMGAPPKRYRPMTGPQSVHGPLRPLAPSPVNAQEHPSGWKRYDAKHPRI